VLLEETSAVELFEFLDWISYRPCFASLAWVVLGTLSWDIFGKMINV
jgi:hypothetical protein